ncbi:MAG: TolC family protein [bacterium]|nr:TolC family protein [bacterium]
MKDPISRTIVGARRCSWIFVGLLLLLSPAVDASEVRATVSLGEETAPAELTDDAGDLGLQRQGDDKVELALEDAIALTLRRNLALVVERYRRTQAIQGIEEAFGIFDTNLGSTLQLSEDTSPTTSLLETAEGGSVTNENVLWNFDVTQLTSHGGTASVAFSNSRFASSNLQFQPNPQFTVGLDFSFSQPLLRNFGRDVTRTNILVAQNNSAISREAFQGEVEAIVQQVSDRYWLLVEALEQLKVAEESLDLAKELHDMNRIQVEVGTMAPLEMVSSEAGVATREEEIIRRQAEVEDSADVLRRFLNLDRAQYWDVDIVPVTDPIIDYVKIEIENAYATALEKRPDVLTQQFQNTNRDIQASFARNQKKPRLDVTGGYGLNGVDGDVTIRDSDSGDIIFQQPGGYSDALDQIFEAESDGWFVQAVFAYPLQNRAARSRSIQAELEVEQGGVEMRDLQQQVLLDVRRLTRAVRTAEQQIESAKVSTKLQRKNREAEQKRYENGLATSFEVLQIQEDLTEAQSREVSAITNYRRALNAFYFATGEILEKVGVELVEGEGEGDS